ncbi:MAG: hypothetical protein QM698_09055 [Micropepsaceae bacterium]
MAWFSRISRYCDAHLVYGQEAPNSCGIASVIMCVFKINKLAPGKTALTLEKDIYKKYEAASGGAYNSQTTGTFPQYLATILTEFTGATWGAQKPPENGVAATIKQKVGVTAGLGPTIASKPIIVGVDWDLGGAHWIVIDSIRTMGLGYNATVCDPWDANLHIQSFELGQPFKYDADSAGPTLDFGGTRNHYQGSENKGKVKTWGVICPV